MMMVQPKICYFLLFLFYIQYTYIYNMIRYEYDTKQIWSIQYINK